MTVAQHRVAGVQFACASLPMLFGACLAQAGDPPQDPDASGAMIEPGTSHPRCDPRYHEARLVATNPTPIADAIWARHASWEAAVRFRLDEGGIPSAISANVTGNRDGREILERFTVQALGAYRFCLPENAPAGNAYVGRMRFSYGRLGPNNGATEMYAQQFVPGYTSADLAVRRAGNVRVRGTFGRDGHPTAVEIVDSSGDAALDAKSLESMAQWLLVFHDAAAVTGPVVYVQPYRYQLR